MKKALAVLGALLAIAAFAVGSAPANAAVIAYGEGTFLIRSTIVIPDGTTLTGAGPGRTILKAAPGFTGTLISSGMDPRHHLALST